MEIDFKPIKTRKIYEEIVEQIKSMVLDGNLSPGDKLLSERDLAEKLQVSRTAVREALSALEMIGILDVRPGDGTYIRETNLDSVIEPLALVLLMERHEIFALLEVRKFLEVGSARLAAERRKSEELAKLEEALENMRRDIQDKTFDESADLRFHYLIAESAHNRLLLRLMNTISDTMRQAFRTIIQKLFTNPETAEIIYRQHQAIYQSIKDRLPEEAHEAMSRHLIYVGEEFSKIVF